MSSEETLDNEESVTGQPDAAGLSEPEQEPAETEETGAGKKTLGVERWVQMAFMVAAILLVWVYDHLIAAVWYLFADPSESLVTVGAVILGGISAVALYRNKPAYSLTHEVAEEMSKVTWPTRKETSNSTVVVVVASLIAAFMLFLFDTVWSAVTDLVYKV
jgi:preprotein translocase subunit SecE